MGEAKLANAIALGQTLKLKNLAVGDGNGNLPMPVRTQKALVREVRRAGLNQLTIDPANASQIIVEQVLPEDVGGWWIREIGIFDEAGDLCAVANCPPSYKPLMAEGSGRTQVVRIVLIVASTAAIELKIDPSVILATRKYVDDQDILVRAYSDAQLAKHLASLDPHPLLAKVAYVDQQDASARAYGDQQLGKHQAALDPHPLLAKIAYVDQQDRNVTADAAQRLAGHMAALDPHPLLAKIAYVDQQDKNVTANAEQRLAGHMAALDPHPLLAKVAYVDQQNTSARAYGDQQDAKHLAALDPHPQYSMKEVQALPKADASKKLASAGFVQQELGNLAGIADFPVSRALSAADFGKAYYFSNGSVTATLPRPDSLASGQIIGRQVKFFGFNKIAGTITPAANAFLRCDSANVATMVVKAGQSLSLVAVTADTWQVIDSTAEMWRNADFADYFNNTAPTQPQRDSSKKIATTEFVRRAQGSMTGYTRVEADRSLTAEDAGSVLLLGNATSVLTLPPPLSLGIPINIGVCVRVHCTGPQSGRLVPAKDAFLMAPDETTSITIKKGQSLTLMATTDQVWRVIDSTAELSRNAAFTGVLAGSGHKCLPDDFIMQWQTVDVPVATTGIATKNFSFPIAFKEFVFGCTATVLGIGAAPNSNAFVAAMPSSINGGVAQNNYVNSNVSVFIISIGK
ncbi:phage tail protein [Janthinobacterium sp. GMG2]|uniref:phage tail protein n=1 Tax=Janthinobacterium sp. GMG2 TaxID=3096606 RepID=UPI0029F4B749|nr:phage tail protein [Janthinobacterium sp. GMG2]MDX8124931.1 phage tail protein [Janthinobacterium sp. GMG2]